VDKTRHALRKAVGIAMLLLLMFGQVNAAIDVTPILKLAIDAPIKAMAGDSINIKVTEGGAGIGNATINIGNDTGITDNNGILNYSLPRNSEGTYSITASKTGYEKATQNIEISNNLLEILCLIDESLISRNIVILIDSSGSTGIGSPSPISLIDANAISVLRSIGRDSRVGIVAFSGVTRQTSILPVNSDANKAELENFIIEIGPKGGDNPTDLDKGLRAAEELLKSVTGTKEIIIISDGLIHLDGLSQTKNTVNDLKKKDIKIQFIQILLPEMSRIPDANYDMLSKTAGTDVILLYPGERINNFREIVPTKEQCSARAYDTMTITVASGKGIPLEGAEISFDGMITGMTNNTGKIDFIFISSGLHNITATKLGYETVEKMVQVLPATNITLNPTAIINQTSNTDLLLKQEVNKIDEPLNKTEEKQAQQETKISWLESMVNSIRGWIKSFF
jgi:hypothetical protein